MVQTLNLNLNHEQVKKLSEALSSSSGLTLKLKPDNFENGKIPLLFSDTQIKKLKGGNLSVKFTPTQIKKIGSALPALIPLISMILAGLGTAASVGTSIANTVNQKSSQTKQLEEQKRHNAIVEKEIQGKGYANKCSKKSPVHCFKCGQGFYLKPYKDGSGFYLKPFLG